MVGVSTYELSLEFVARATACCCSGSGSGSGEAVERSEPELLEAELLEAVEEGAGEASLTALLDFLAILASRKGNVTR